MPQRAEDSEGSSGADASAAGDSCPRFFRPGRRIVEWFERHNVRKSLPWLPFATSTALVVFWFLMAVSGGWIFTTLAFLTLVIKVGESYLQGAAKYGKRSLVKRIWRKVAEHKRDVAGLIATFGRELERCCSACDAESRARCDAHLDNLQERLLDAIVQVVVRFQGLEEPREISANWAVRIDLEGSPYFVVDKFDRAMTDRRTENATPHPISELVPGAGRAFVTGERQFVPDTMDNSIRSHFKVERPYRAILSIPVSLSAGEITGVVNIDCRRTGVLIADMQYLVQDLCELVGLCEVLRRVIHDVCDGEREAEAGQERL